MKSIESLNNKIESMTILSSTKLHCELTLSSTDSSLANRTERTTDDLEIRMIASNYIEAIENDNLIICTEVTL